ncbi:hypothetical protein GCM10023322_80810 [Rugosimonospora acidiphila]|uniref:Uncharacterized protein n=1 Tax=Rugosimonospora acidiphila TaxID=556531 RepID=A0ABP9SU84_9ACTN
MAGRPGGTGGGVAGGTAGASRRQRGWIASMVRMVRIGRGRTWRRRVGETDASRFFAWRPFRERAEWREATRAGATVRLNARSGSARVTPRVDPDQSSDAAGGCHGRLSPMPAEHAVININI